MVTWCLEDADEEAISTAADAEDGFRRNLREAKGVARPDGAARVSGE
jgi:hypothetical protein